MNVGCNIETNVHVCLVKQNELMPEIFPYRDSMGSAIHQEKQMTIEPRIVELFIDLMCRFRPNEVHNYIKMNEGYRLEQTLEVSCIVFCLNEVHNYYTKVNKPFGQVDKASASKSEGCGFKPHSWQEFFIL